jgi:hypothetical protein
MRAGPRREDLTTEGTEVGGRVQAEEKSLPQKNAMLTKDSLCSVRSFVAISVHESTKKFAKESNAV